MENSAFRWPWVNDQNVSSSLLPDRSTFVVTTRSARVILLEGVLQVESIHFPFWSIIGSILDIRLLPRTILGVKLVGFGIPPITPRMNTTIGVIEVESNIASSSDASNLFFQVTQWQSGTSIETRIKVGEECLDWSKRCETADVSQ